MELSLTFSDEFKGKLDVEGVGAVQISGHDHSHTILQSKVTAAASCSCVCVVDCCCAVAQEAYPFEDKGSP